MEEPSSRMGVGADTLWTGHGQRIGWREVACIIETINPSPFIPFAEISPHKQLDRRLDLIDRLQGSGAGLTA